MGARYVVFIVVALGLAAPAWALQVTLRCDVADKKSTIKASIVISIDEEIWGVAEEKNKEKFQIAAPVILTPDQVRLHATKEYAIPHFIINRLTLEVERPHVPGSGDNQFFGKCEKITFVPLRKL